MKRKMIALCLTAVLAAGCLTGCGSREDNTGTSSGNLGKESSVAAGESLAAEEKTGFNETGYPIVNEPVTLTAMIQVRDMDTLMDINEMPAIKRLEEQTGIHIEWEQVKEADWDTKVSLMFASGEYPDIIFNCVTNPIDFEEYGVDQKILIPLDGLIEKYMPVYTERISAEEEDPMIALVASDGHTYSIGSLDQTDSCTNVYTFINQEWLDNLGLPMPTTLEELTDVLRAFKTQDPNGNGKNDEMPCEIGVNTSTHSVKNIMYMFGLPVSDGSSWIYIDEDRKVQFAPTQQGFRDCMEWIHTLYEEELVSPELLSQDIPTIETKLKEGNCGFFWAWRIKNKGFDEGVEKSCVLFTPTWSSDIKKGKMIRMAKNGVYLTCTNEHVAETLRYLDAMLEPELMYSIRYGEKDAEDGWFYNAEGKMERYPTTSTGGSTVLNVLGSNSLYVSTKKFGTEHIAKTDATLTTTEYSNTYLDAGIMQTYSNELLGLVILTPEQNKKFDLMKTDINNAVMEWIATFITQGVNDENWNQFINVFAGMDIDEYLQAYQEGLDKIS